MREREKNKHESSTIEATTEAIQQIGALYPLTILIYFGSSMEKIFSRFNF